MSYVSDMTKAERVLRYIGKFPYGVSYSDIQNYVCTMNGRNYGQMDCLGRRKNRGYWSTNLATLLPKFCRKLPGRRGKWVLVVPDLAPYFTHDTRWARGKAKHMNEHHRKQREWQKLPPCYAAVRVDCDYPNSKDSYYSYIDINNSNGLWKVMGEWITIFFSGGYEYRRRYEMI